VIEIGNTLREARSRRGLELPAVERETRIRARYLAALEQERFELLPARAYAKGFLRVYADFLGLDGPLIVDEFNARFPETEEPELESAQLPAGVTSRRMLARRLSGLLVAGAVIALLGVLAWRFAASPGKPGSPASAPTRTKPSETFAAPAALPPKHTTARLARLVLHASGPCWLFVRAGSAAGPVLYEATLAAGAKLSYTLAPGRPQLWLRIGAPWNLELTLNGGRVRSLPPGPANVLVTRGGLQPA